MRAGPSGPVAAALTGAVIALTLAACSSSDTGTAGGGASSCTNTVKQPDATEVTVWAWYPGFEQVVDQFNATHDDLQVCWTNAGQGADEYSKFSTAIEAGTGAPDVIMLEAEVLPTYSILNSLVDLSAYGAGQLEDEFTPGAWADVSSGEAVYAVPVDGGPMGMLYRKDIFDKYHVPVPTTWAEFALAARQLKDAGFEGTMTDFPTNGRALNYALLAQSGWTPFDYDAAAPTQIGITVNTDEATAVLTYWDELIDAGLVATDDAFTSDYNTSLVDGTYAVYLAAAWGPGYLQGLSDADADAVWQVAPLPQWDAAHPVQVNWGGSTFAVTTQASDPASAAKVAMGLFGTQEAWTLGIEEAALFPQWTPVLESEEFGAREYPFFAGQQINAEVFLPAAQGYEGFTFSPFQNYAYDRQTEALYAMVTEGTDPGKTLDSVQSSLVEYAREQGFTVVE